MFKTHQPAIQTSVWESEEHMYRALLFVRLSIRRHLEHVGDMVNLAVEEGPDALPNAQEKRSCAELSLLASKLFHHYSADSNPLDILRESVRVFGIGVVKAGFIAQLLTGHIGCLDSHNLKMYGITERFELGASWQRNEAKLLTYVALCAQLGGSGNLWDMWCEHVSRIRPKVWPTAESVSQYHVDVITGLHWRF